MLMRCCGLFLFVSLFSLLPTAAGLADPAEEPLKESPYFAYVGREYIFTIEIVKPGNPILNFVSMTDREEKLRAKDVRLDLGNRQAAARLFHIELDRNQQDITVPSISVHPRSSFGFSLGGSFGNTQTLRGVEIDFNEGKFKLAPLAAFDFETLVRKINRINLKSPDFRDDFQVLNLDLIGTYTSGRP